MAWKDVRVFISSTFRDMQAERDHLVRFVFPRLRQELLERQIHLVDVDLRWGVTGGQDALEVCREIIDECRPHFLCLLGGRYGWIPPAQEQSITAAEVQFAVLDCLGRHGKALFYFRDLAATAAMVEDKPGQYREPAGSLAERRLDALKETIAKAGLSPVIYGANWDTYQRRLVDLEEFGEAVYRDLLKSIDDELGDRVPATNGLGSQMPAASDALADERAAMEAFIEERTRSYFVGSRWSTLNGVRRHAEGVEGNGYLCVTGYPGSGKSALLGQFCRKYSGRSAHPDALVIPHFVGASPGSTDVRRVLRRLCHELAAGAGLEDRIPEQYERLRRTFQDFLERAARTRHVVIVIDAIDQLDPAYEASSMLWLPNDLPANVWIVLSCSPCVALEALRVRLHPPRELPLPALTESDVTSIIQAFLKRYRKKMSEEQIRALIDKPMSSSPLYLCVALEELRTLGVHEEMTARIRELPGETQALFRWVLRRLEQDPGFREQEDRTSSAALTRRLVSSLAASRHGLSQAEICELLSPGRPDHTPPIPPDHKGNVAALLRLLRTYLLSRGELLDFGHAQFRTAVETLVFQEEEDRIAAHQRLAVLFRQRADPRGDATWTGDHLRGFGELPFHMTCAKDYPQLSELVRTGFLDRKADLLSDSDALIDARSIAKALSTAGDDHWSSLIDAAYAHCRFYERVQLRPETLASLAQEGDLERIQAVLDAEPDETRRGLMGLAAATFLEETGHGAKVSSLLERAKEDLTFLTEMVDRKKDVPWKTKYQIAYVLLEGAGRPTPKRTKKKASIAWEQALTVNKASAAPRRSITLGFILLSHLRSGFGRGLVSIALPLLAGFIIGHHFGNPLFTGQRGWKEAGNFMIWCLVTAAIVFSWHFVYKRLIGLVDERRAEPVARMLAGIGQALQVAPTKKRKKLLLRAIRFCRLMEVGDEVLIDILTQHFRNPENAENTALTAELVLVATGLHRPIREVLLAHCRRLGTCQLQAVHAELVKGRQLADDRWHLFENFAKTADITCAPEHLLGLVPEPQAHLAYNKTEEASKHPILRLLRRVERSCLAMAILLSLRPRTQSKSENIIEYLRSAVVRVRSWVWTRQAWLKAPLSIWEPFICAPVFVVTAVPIGFLMSVMYLSIIFMPPWLHFIQLFIRTHDPWGLSTPSADDLTHLNSVLAQRRGEWLSVSAVHPWIRRSVLAVSLLRQQVIDLGRYPQHSVRAISRLTRRLVRRGLVAQGSSIVLAAMGNRSLLDALTAARPHEGAVRRVSLGESAHREQLRRVLPLPAWRNLSLVAAVALLAGLLFVESVARFRLQDLSALLQHGPLPVMALCLYFVMLQHIPWPRQRSKDIDKKADSKLPLSFFLLMIVGGIVDDLFKDERLIWVLPSIWAWLSPLLLTNLITPLVISYWRGSNLLYPTRISLWIQRVAAVALAVTACILLALIGFPLLWIIEHFPFGDHPLPIP
jgi:hypothetical protein